MRRMVRWAGIGALVIAALLLFTLSGVGAAPAKQAATPQPTPAATAASDEQCLACHSQPDQIKTFPNGEQLYLSLDSAAYHNGLHSQSGKVNCTSCHTDITGYPHPELKVQNQRDSPLSILRHANNVTPSRPRRTWTACTHRRGRKAMKMRLFARTAITLTTPLSRMNRARIFRQLAPNATAKLPKNIAIRSTARRCSMRTIPMCPRALTATAYTTFRIRLSPNFCSALPSCAPSATPTRRRWRNMA